MTPISLRADWTPEDLAWVASRHGALYAAEHGFDSTFEEYVAGPLAAFARARSERERLWIAEREGQRTGCVAIVAAAPGIAQVRWFLVEPEGRGAGVGTALLDAAVAFARRQGYASVVLWTVSALEAASRLYRRAGFVRTEENRARRWGVEVVEEKYELSLEFGSRRDRG